MQTLYPQTEADLIKIFQVAKASGAALCFGCYGEVDRYGEKQAQAAGVQSKDAFIFDHTKHLNRLLAFDMQRQLVMVQPGMLLADLNAFVLPHGLCLPIDLGAQADQTIDHLVSCNTLGTHFKQFGRVVHFVAAIEALLDDGSSVRFSTFGDGGDMQITSLRMRSLIPQLFTLAAQYREQIAQELGSRPWRTQGYNLDIFDETTQVIRPYNPNRSVNLAHLLVGSRGRLALSKNITLRLAKLAPQNTQTAPLSRAESETENVAFSPALQQAFESVRQLFDPQNRLNR